jgi:ABC-type dipeptide/oligopeptide/nickel transport system permease component
MRQIWQTILNNRTAGIVFVCAIVLLFLFLWKSIDPASYNSTVNGFLQDLWEIVKSFIYMVIALVIMYLGVARIFGFGPFRKKKSGGH